jgi:hypothetical protein
VRIASWNVNALTVERLVRIWEWLDYAQPDVICLQETKQTDAAFPALFLALLAHYLRSRREGLFDWIVFHRPNRLEPQEMARQVGLDRSKPIIGLLTNVSWDAQLHYPANAFPSMLEWLVQTCEYFATRPDLQLIIRVHPAEISGFPANKITEIAGVIMPSP